MAVPVAEVNRVYEAFGESKTLRAWSEDRRSLVGFDRLKYLVSTGVPVAEAMQSPAPAPKTYSAFGETLTLPEWLDHPARVADRQTVRDRLNAGWDIATALTVPPRPVTFTVVEAFGETKAPHAWSQDDRCVVSYKALLYRLAAGMDPENLPQSDPSKMNFGGDAKKAWKDIWGCGQGIGAIKAVSSTAVFVDKLLREYAAASGALEV